MTDTPAPTLNRAQRRSHSHSLRVALKAWIQIYLSLQLLPIATWKQAKQERCAAMTTKRCFKCLCEKPIGAFYKHAAMRDGRLNKCKECTKTDVAEHRQANLERVRSYDRMRNSMPHRVAAREAYRQTQAYAQSHAAAAKRWSEKYPERRKASHTLNNALRDGKVVRQPCLICGEYAHAHHPNYDQPLLVVWLCPKHHAEAHAQDRHMQRDALQSSAF